MEIEVFTKDDDCHKIICVSYDKRFCPLTFNIDYIPEEKIPFFISVMSKVVREMAQIGYNKGQQSVQDPLREALKFLIK